MKQAVQTNGVDLCIETFGDRAAPATLLIAGAASSMDWWEEELCERLAAGGRFVIRYDLRDTGQSTTYEPGAPGYGRLDLVGDAIGVLDALDVSRAHLVGISMGAGLAQRLVLDHPDRVASLTLFSTSGRGTDLPPMSDDLAAVFAEPQDEPDWSSRAAAVEYIVEGQAPFSGSVRMDETSLRTLVEKVFDRTTNIASSMTNHWILDEGEPVGARLSEITAPTLVVHGTEDPLFPYGHGEALAAAIPGATLIPLVGVGHEMPPRATWDVVVSALLDHTAPR